MCFSICELDAINCFFQLVGISVLVQFKCPCDRGAEDHYSKLYSVWTNDKLVYDALREILHQFKIVFPYTATRIHQKYNVGCSFLATIT